MLWLSFFCYEHLSSFRYQGDSNVPAGEISIDMDLSAKIYLNQEQQSSLVILGQIGREDFNQPENEGDIKRQPFQVPNDVVRDGIFQYPNFCTSRFVSMSRYYSLTIVHPGLYQCPDITHQLLYIQVCINVQILLTNLLLCAFERMFKIGMLLAQRSIESLFILQRS